jgi:hypothetical protein
VSGKSEEVRAEHPVDEFLRLVSDARLAVALHPILIDYVGRSTADGTVAMVVYRRPNDNASARVFVFQFPLQEDEHDNGFDYVGEALISFREHAKSVDTEFTEIQVRVSSPQPIQFLPKRDQ